MTCTSKQNINLLLPGRRKNFLGLVVTSKSVNTALHQNQSELAVLVLKILTYKMYGTKILIFKEK